MERTGKYKWSDFTLTDNTCKQQSETPLVLREKFARKAVIQTEDQLQEALTAVRANAVDSIDRTEKGAEKSVLKLEAEVEKFLDEIGRDVVVVEQEIEKDVVAVEKEVEKDVIEVEKDFSSIFGFGKKR